MASGSKDRRHCREKVESYAIEVPRHQPAKAKVGLEGQRTGAVGRYASTREVRAIGRKVVAQSKRLLEILEKY